jgi:protein TonB
MTAQHPLRLPAAFAASAGVHAVVLAIVLRAGVLGGSPEPAPEARLIPVRLVARAGGGGGGPLPGLPTAAAGAPGGESEATLPHVELAAPPPAAPRVARMAEQKPFTAALPAPVRFPRVVAGTAPEAARPPAAAVAAAQAGTAAAAADARVARLGEEAERGAGGDAAGGGGGGGEGLGSGDGSGGDGSNALARPAYGSNPKPPYPLAARRLGIEGVVTLEVLVRRDGTPAEVRVRTSSGSSLLDDSAVATVRSRWRFVPARRGTETIESRVTVPIRFRLDAG